MAEGLDVGTLSGRVELEDKMSSVLNRLSGQVDSFDSRIGGVGARVAEQAAGFFTAEAAIAAVSKAMDIAIGIAGDLEEGLMGGADIAASFDRLTESAGLSATVLDTLRTATHGTVTDLELMKTVNQDLAAGMNLTEQQFQALADGAFALANATGVSVKEALDTMNDAMLTGRTRALAMLTGKIDLEAAEQKYAASLKTTVDRLTSEEKLLAARAGILESVTSATTRLGEQTDGLDEKVAQAQVSYQNFMDTLGTSISESPAILAGIDAIGEALLGAFGGSQEDLIKAIVTALEDAAITTLEWAKTASDAVALVAMGFHELGIVFTRFGQGVNAIGFAVETLILSFMKLIDTITFGTTGIGGAIDSLEGHLDKVYNKMAEGENAIAAHRKAQDEWAVTTGQINEKLEQVRQKMIAAQQTQTQHTEGVKMSAQAQQFAAEWTAKNAEATQSLGDNSRKTQEEIKKMKAAQDELKSSGVTWQETVKAMDVTLVESIKRYLEAGVSQGTLAAAYGVTATQVTAVGKALDEQQKAMKLEEKTLQESQARWAEYHALRAVRSGSTTEQLILNIKQWETEQINAHIRAKTDTADFYEWVGSMSKEMYAAETQQRLEADINSKAHFEKLARDAQDAYDFASRNSHQYTQEHIRNLELASRAAEQAAMRWTSALGGSLDTVTGMVRTLAGEMITLEEQARRMNEGFQFTAERLTEFDIKRQGGAQKLLKDLEELANVLPTLKANVKGFASQQLYMEAQLRYNLLKEAYPLLVRMIESKGGGFAEGGYGDFGDGTLAVLHGKEAIVPMDGAGSSWGGGGGMTNVFYVNGTGQDVARIASEHIMRKLKSAKQFWSA